MHLNKTACEIWSVFDKVHFWVKDLTPFFHRTLQLKCDQKSRKEANVVYYYISKTSDCFKILTKKTHSTANRPFTFVLHSQIRAAAFYKQF